MNDGVEERDALKFNSMSIDRGRYGDDKGKLTAKVRCDRYEVALEVVIPDDVVNDIMKLIAPVIAASVNKSLIDTQRAHESWMLSNTQDVVDAIAAPTTDSDDPF